MSLKTWKKEFYPQSAKRTKQSEAVEHSLHKWRGILPANLKKHGLNRDINRIEDENERDVLVKKHVSSLRTHIKDLASKNYQQLYSNVNSLESRRFSICKIFLSISLFILSACS